MINLKNQLLISGAAALVLLLLGIWLVMSGYVLAVVIILLVMCVYVILINVWFRSFVTEYRVAHAKRLMKEHPEMRLSQVADESGFSNEKTFLRTFKSITGLTPTEWKKGASFMISSK